MGRKGIKNTYTPDNNNTKLYEPKDKEKQFRLIWSNIFKISDEENQNFDLNHEATVTDLTNISKKRNHTPLLIRHA